MKKTILTTIVFVLAITMSFSQSKTEITKATFGVQGKCEKCKLTIEKAANSVEGVSSAIWNQESKKINVSFNASKTNLKKVQEAIAASGYDTDLVKASTASQKKLTSCCQYDKEMGDKKKCPKKKKKSCKSKSE